MRLVQLPRLTLAFTALMMAAQTNLRAEPMNRVAVGAEYGTQQLVMCPPHHVVVGLREVVGYWLYMVRPICQRIGMDGGLIGGGVLGPAELSNPGGLGAHQIWDFYALTVTCQSNGSVAAFDGTMIPVTDHQIEDGSVFLMPGFIRPYCRQAGTESLERSTDAIGWTPPGNQEMPWASFDAPQAFNMQFPAGGCEPGTVAVGVWGHADTWLRSFGLVCQPFDEVRPLTIAERGAAVVPFGNGAPPGADVVPGRNARTISVVSGGLAPCLRYDPDPGIGRDPDAALRVRDGCQPPADARSVAVTPPSESQDPEPNVPQRGRAARSVAPSAVQQPPPNEPAQPH